jgi:hypothetical protein
MLATFAESIYPMYTINGRILNLKPRQSWHHGELAIQQKLGVASAVADSWSWHQGSIPTDQRVFHTSKLSFLPLTTLEPGDKQKPWVSLVTPPNNGGNFVSSPDEHTLVVDIAARAGDPIIENTRGAGEGSADGDDDMHLVAGIGIELATRRRNKFAGSMCVECLNGGTYGCYRLVMAVNQAIGNCP